MHAVIINDLEEYLAGAMPPWAERRFQSHLDTCDECRQEVQAMREVGELVCFFKPSDPAEPSPGFVARVMGEVARRPAPSFWSPLLDFGLGRRLVFASLLTLAVLGTVLVSRESTYAPAPPTPEAVMAVEQNSPSADSMLVTLATYEP